MARNYTTWFKALRTAADAQDSYQVKLCLMAAEENAAYTDGVALDSPEYYEMAYRSICYTGIFTDDAAVRDWLVVAGYEW